MHPRKVEDHEKINQYSPTLTISYPPPYGDVQVLMRSPKYLAPPDKDGHYLVTYTQAYERGRILDIRFLYELTKDLIKKAADDYYDALFKAEIYEIPEEIEKMKWGDTLLLVEEEQ